MGDEAAASPESIDPREAARDRAHEIARRHARAARRELGAVGPLAELALASALLDEALRCSGRAYASAAGSGEPLPSPCDEPESFDSCTEVFAIRDPVSAAVEGARRALGIPSWVLEGATRRRPTTAEIQNALERRKATVRFATEVRRCAHEGSLSAKDVAAAEPRWTRIAWAMGELANRAQRSLASLTGEADYREGRPSSTARRAAAVGLVMSIAQVAQIEAVRRIFAHASDRQDATGGDSFAWTDLVQRQDRALSSASGRRRS